MAKSKRKGRKKINKTRNAGVVGTGGVQMMRGQQRRSSKASAQRRQTPTKTQRRSSRSVPVFYGYHSDDYFEPRDENNKVIPKPPKVIIDWPKKKYRPFLDYIIPNRFRRGNLAEGIKKKRKKKKKKSRNSKK